MDRVDKIVIAACVCAALALLLILLLSPGPDAATLETNFTEGWET